MKHNPVRLLKVPHRVALLPTIRHMQFNLTAFTSTTASINEVNEPIRTVNSKIIKIVEIFYDGFNIKTIKRIDEHYLTRVSHCQLHFEFVIRSPRINCPSDPHQAHTSSSPCSLSSWAAKPSNQPHWLFWQWVKLKHPWQPWWLSVNTAETLKHRQT